MSAPVEELFASLRAVEAHWLLGEMDRDDVVDMWLELDNARGELARILKLVSEDASDRLADRDDPRAEYVTSHGDVVHLEPGYSAERWRGHDVLAELAETYVEPTTGEQVPAVPIHVLVDVLPGCATPELTSSKWRTTGLGRYVQDWRRYRSRDDAPLVIRRGAPRSPWTPPRSTGWGTAPGRSA